MTEAHGSLDAQNEHTDLEAAIEVMIFMSKDPVTIEQMVEVMLGQQIKVTPAVIKKVLQTLLLKWEDKDRILGRGITLKKAAGGYLFCTAPEHSHVAKAISKAKPLELSKAQIEVLSIIAYRQPITRVDVDDIRGVDSSAAIKRLMQLKLLKILGKSEGLGRPLLYGTTKHFLEFFSLNSLNDLPTLKHYESLGSGGDSQVLDLTGQQISLVDLFKTTGTSMFSEEIERASVEALKGLDDALLRIDGAEEQSANKG